MVYIAGRSYSGSTLLDLLISSHSEAFGLGEVRVLSERKRREGKQHVDRRCTCGAENKAACEFWARVDERLRDRTGPSLRSLDVFDHDQNRAVLDAAFELSGKRLLVDSSKRTDRLEQLLADDTLDVRPIHIVRDPRGEVHAQMKRGHSLREKARMYTRGALELDRILRDRNHLVVRYERLAGSPRAEVERVMTWLGVAPEETQFDWTRQVHHHLAGNRMRFGDNAEIRLDEAWRERLTFREKLTIATMTLPARLPRSGLHRLWPEHWR